MEPGKKTGNQGLDIDDERLDIDKEIELLLKEINHSAVKKCVECRGCENDCPSFKVLDGYDPTRVNVDLLNRDIEKWIKSDMIWQCLECHTCTEMCPQSYSWEKVLLKMKSLAMRLNLAPKSVQKGEAAYLKTGLLAAVRSDRARKKLNLPTMAATGRESFLKLKEHIMKDGE